MPETTAPTRSATASRGKQQRKNRATFSQLRSTPAFTWLSKFVKAPKYNANWDVTRTAAFLNLYEAARLVLNRKLPNPAAAAVLRHRAQLLNGKDLQLLAALAFLPPKALESLTAEHTGATQFIHLTPQQLAALDPSPDEIANQCCAPSTARSKSTHPQEATNRATAHST